MSNDSNDLEREMTRMGFTIDPDGILFSRDPLDFTQPKLVWVGDTCIRDFHDYSVRAVEIPEYKILPCYEEESDMVNCMEVEDNFDLTVTEDGIYLLQFHVPPRFHSSIIGEHRSVYRGIEERTNTFITIPKKGSTADIKIEGIKERDVMSAKHSIELVVLAARERLPPTHFLSIPVISNEIKQNFETFKRNILNGPPIAGLDQSMFQNPNKLHLTIVPLVLVDELEEKEAISLLKECKEKFVNRLLGSAESLQIILEGVEIMNDDPTDVDVLYGRVKINPPQYQSYFKELVNEIVNYFALKGYVQKKNENVKLHVTLINSLFRKTDNRQTPNEQPRKSFDAREILGNYRHYEFGSADIDYIHLSIRFTRSPNSYYEALTTIPLK